MGKTPNLAVLSRRGFEVQKSKGMCLGRPGGNIKVIQKMLAHDMRRFAQSFTNTNIDPRFPKIDRHELCVAVGEMQKRQIAKSRHVVLNARICKNAAVDRHASGACHRQQAHEFSAIKTHLDTSISQSVKH